MTSDQRERLRIILQQSILVRRGGRIDEPGEANCEECGERDLLVALVPVYVATKAWHRVEKLVHPECCEMFVAANLEAVMAATRLGAVAS